MCPNYSACQCFQQVTENAPKCVRGPFRDLNRKSEYPPPSPWDGQGERPLRRKSRAHGPQGSTNLQHLSTVRRQSAAAPAEGLEFQAFVTNPAAKLSLFRWVHLCTYACIYACVYICTCICIIYIYIYIYMYVCMYVCMHVRNDCTYVCVCMCMYVCMYVCR